MDHNTLVAAVDALAVPYKTEFDKIHSAIKEKIGETLVEAGVDKIAKVNYYDNDSADIEVDIPGKKYGHKMAFYFFEKDWNLLTGAKKVTLNIGTVGPFSADDKPEMNFYIVAGALAKSLPELQKKINSIDFGPYMKARHNYYAAKGELERFDRAAKNAELEKKAHEIEEKLVPGVKLRIGTSAWNNEPIVDEIVRVTNNLIFFKNPVYGSQIKKDVAVNRILEEQWEFVA